VINKKPKSNPRYKLLQEITCTVIKKYSSEKEILYGSQKGSRQNLFRLRVRLKSSSETDIYFDLSVWNLVEEGALIPIVYRRNILGFNAYLNLEKLSPVLV